MSIRKWVYLFFTTLLIGGGIGCVLGVAFSWEALTSEGVLNFVIGVVEFFGIGCMFSVFSQMGYFAYLTVHRFGLGIFGSFWSAILYVLTLFVLFDVFYLRQAAFKAPEESYVSFLFIPILLLIIGVLVSYIKMKETNVRAFAPTLFLMIVVTVAEWYYPLKANEPASMWPAFAVLVVCNAWQVLLQHRLLTKPNKPAGAQ